jgi:hypothetical protein
MNFTFQNAFLNGNLDIANFVRWRQVKDKYWSKNINRWSKLRGIKKICSEFIRTGKQWETKKYFTDDADLIVRHKQTARHDTTEGHGIRCR